MITYKGYTGTVEVDEEANVLHGAILGIKDVVTFEGTSVAELRQAFQDSVDDYLAFCKERGEEPDKPFSGRFVVRIPTDLHRQISIAAAQVEMSLNAWVEEQLRSGVSEIVVSGMVEGSRVVKRTVTKGRSKRTKPKTSKSQTGESKQEET